MQLGAVGVHAGRALRFVLYCRVRHFVRCDPVYDLDRPGGDDGADARGQHGAWRVCGDRGLSHRHPDEQLGCLFLGVHRDRKSVV